MVSFFSLVRDALEHKAGTTYGAVIASSEIQQEDEPQDAEDATFRKQGDGLRYGKKCLAFLGAPDTFWRMLLWSAVGQIIMIVHYRLFKHVTWYSHRRSATPVDTASGQDDTASGHVNMSYGQDDEDPLLLFDFCPGFWRYFGSHLRE